MPRRRCRSLKEIGDTRIEGQADASSLETAHSRTKRPSCFYQKYNKSISSTDKRLFVPQRLTEFFFKCSVLFKERLPVCVCD